MNTRHTLLGLLALALLVLSLFSYKRESHSVSPQGNTMTETINYDGCTLSSFVLGIWIVISLRSLNRSLKDLALRVGLPKKLPKVPYQWLPIALIPFGIIGFGWSDSIQVGQDRTTVTSGWGQSNAKIAMFILLCVLIFIAKFRRRLSEIEQSVN